MRELGEKKQAVLDALAASPGSTTREVASVLGRDIGQIATACSEMLRAGLLRKEGDKAPFHLFVAAAGTGAPKRGATKRAPRAPVISPSTALGVAAECGGVVGLLEAERSRLQHEIDKIDAALAALRAA